MRAIGFRLAGSLAVVAALGAADHKLTPEDRLELVRGLSAEYATVKVMLPRSKKPLEIAKDGTYDRDDWASAARKEGVAARVGDLVQITKLEIEGDEIKMEINGGVKSGVKWYDRVQIGVGGGGNSQGPVTPSGTPTSGTNLTVKFPDGVPSMDAQDVKKILAPLLDFEKHSATENYVDTLPEPIQNAIKENRAVEGMNKEQVIIAIGKPTRKIRETKDGIEYEDWIYGTSGKITFVTFNGDTVVKVKEAYAGLSGSTVAPLPPN